MKDLLVATTNSAKFEEACAVLAEEDIRVLGLKDFPGVTGVVEAADTFLENAILKASGYFWQTKVPTIADDGGLMVDFLNGLPGVHSHRWLGEDADDGVRVGGGEVRQ